MLALKGLDVALTLGILIAVVAGALVAILARARGWKWGAVLGAVLVGCAAYVDFTSDLGPDVVAPSLVTAAATKLIVDRLVERRGPRSPFVWSRPHR